jgi:3D (Asp-Asp-Asp) domain-containing protein
MKATAYTSDYASTGKSPGDYGFGRTATGTQARRNPNGFSSIAVDPRVIPYGTKLYVEGYGYAIAEDTGGAIKGNIIDVYFNSAGECSNWGVRYVNVYILK